MPPAATALDSRVSGIAWRCGSARRSSGASTAMKCRATSTRRAARPRRAAAARCGPCGSLMAIDLVRTFGVQWLRTGLPVIALVAASIQLAVAQGLAAFARTASDSRCPTSGACRTPRSWACCCIAITSFVLIGMTITLNLWVTRLNRRRAAAGNRRTYALRARTDEAVRRPARARSRRVSSCSRARSSAISVPTDPARARPSTWSSGCSNRPPAGSRSAASAPPRIRSPTSAASDTSPRSRRSTRISPRRTI